MKFRHDPTAADVRAESARRLRSLMNARDDAHLAQKINELTAELTDLNALEATPERDSRRAAILATRETIKMHDRCSKRLREMDRIPGDYQNEKWWNDERQS